MKNLVATAQAALPEIPQLQHKAEFVGRCLYLLQVGFGPAWQVEQDSPLMPRQHGRGIKPDLSAAAVRSSGERYSRRAMGRTIECLGKTPVF